MSTRPAEPPPGPRPSPGRRRRGAAALGAALAGLLTLGLLGVGCTPPSPPAAQTSPSPSDAPSAAAPPAPRTFPVPPDLARALGRLLDRRAAALASGDRAAFRAGLDGADPAFLAEQWRYFRNLQQLPLARLSYRLDRRSLLRAGGDYWVTVLVSLQLRGYDAEPVVRPDRYRFSAAGGGGRGKGARFRLSSVTDAAWERAHDVTAQPWEDRPIRVRRGAGVLGIFDPVTVAGSRGVVASVERAINEVSRVVPYPWTRSVVVYALADTSLLSAVGGLPGHDPELLDGVAFTVPARPGEPRVASTRVALQRRVVSQPATARGRLVRHELAHVAIGGRDDRAPLWLSEGIAEYVSVRPMAPEDRRLPRAALVAARRAVERASRPPTDAAFEQGPPAVQYALSWWVCEYVASTYGEATLWTLLDELGRPTTGGGVRSVLGLSPGRLARQGARLLLATYAPEPEPTATSSPSPTSSSSASPTSGSPSPTSTSGPSRVQRGAR